MGFGGSVAGMILSLKNNKRKRVSAFEKLERYQKENSDQLHFKNKASAKQLKEIKLKLKKENRISFIKNGILFTLLLLVFYFLIGFAFF
ncbi:MAG: hypothetical protein ACPGU6_03525 [Tenacibaculum sp.]